jgi:hypothetical protein
MERWWRRETRQNLSVRVATALARSSPRIASHTHLALYMLSHRSMSHVLLDCGERRCCQAGRIPGGSSGARMKPALHRLLTGGSVWMLTKVLSRKEPKSKQRGPERRPLRACHGLASSRYQSRPVCLAAAVGTARTTRPVSEAKYSSSENFQISPCLRSPHWPWTSEVSWLRVQARCVDPVKADTAQ